MKLLIHDEVIEMGVDEIIETDVQVKHCAMCKEFIGIGSSSKKSIREFRDVYGQTPDEYEGEVVLVCEECYRIITSFGYV